MGGTDAGCRPRDCAMPLPPPNTPWLPAWGEIVGVRATVYPTKPIPKTGYYLDSMTEECGFITAPNQVSMRIKLTTVNRHAFTVVPSAAPGVHNTALTPLYSAWSSLNAVNCNQVVLKCVWLHVISGRDRVLLHFADMESRENPNQNMFSQAIQSLKSSNRKIWRYTWSWKLTLVPISALGFRTGVGMNE